MMGHVDKLPTTEFAQRLVAHGLEHFADVSGWSLAMGRSDPRWLVSKGRSIEAARVLARIDRERSTQEEIGEIERALAEEPVGRWAALFQPGLRIALFAGVALAVLSQITGINAIIYFGPRILEEAGLKIGDALGGQVIIGFVNVTATIGAILVIDRLGRKKLMSAGTFAMAVTLLAVSFLFAAGKAHGAFLLFFILCYIAAFAFGYGPVVWTLLAEIYPTRIRGRAMSVATFSLWIGTAFIGQVVPWMLKVLTPAVTFLVFAICCIPVFLVLRLIPETKGKSLEQIERFWLR